MTHTRRYLGWIVFICLLLGQSGQVCAQKSPSARSKEYKIKAAYLYNYLKIIGWPEELPPEMQEQMTLGILGPNPFGDGFKALETKTAQGKPIKVQYFESFASIQEALDANDLSEQINQQIEQIRQCNVLFISKPDSVYLPSVLSLIKERPILTVGESPGFLEGGGLVNFVDNGKKGGFEIDLGHVKRLGLTVSSKLLRLAERVIEEKK